MVLMKDTFSPNSPRAPAGDPPSPPATMSDLEEVEFDPDIHPSYVGRLVRVRDNAESDAKWRHAVLCFAMTEWVIEEDPSRRGKRVKLEKPTGGYQLQWGLFERVEQARTQKRGQQSVRPSGEPRSRAAPRRGASSARAARDFLPSNARARGFGALVPAPRPA
jgi:hypothetical protein